MIFENMAASILQRLDKESDIDENVSAGPYFFNENYGKTDARSIYEPEIESTDTTIDDDEGKFISDFVKIAAEQILSGYVVGKDKINPEKLIYINDKHLIDAISRKTTQLHSLLKSGYGKEIAKAHIEQAIRRQLKYLAYNA